jgi:hypothetical protein
MNFKMNLFMILALGAGIMLSSCKKDKEEETKKTPNDPCASFFTSVAGKNNMSKNNASGELASKFTKSIYEAEIFSNSNLVVKHDSGEYTFTKAMITKCEVLEKETNVFYDNTSIGVKALMQYENDNLYLEVYTATSSVRFMKLAPPDLTLLKNIAGTYTVTSVTSGSHTRNTFIINADGSINYDADKQYSTSEITTVWDRRSCCNAIYVDLTSQKRMDIFFKADSTSLSHVTYDFNHINF